MSEDEVEVDIDLTELDVNENGETVPYLKDSLFQQFEKPKRYSATLITQYQKCPASAYARITKQPENKSVALVNGIALHEAIEKYIKFREPLEDTYKRVFDEQAQKNEIVIDGNPELDKVFVDAKKMVVNAKANLDADGFVDRIDPNLCEVSFNFVRNGRQFTGKMDLLHFGPDGQRFTIIDAKSSKTAPAKDVLDKDLQFSLYHYGAMVDESLPTFGKWAQKGMWWHLRGKNVAKDDTGKTTRKEADKRYQFFFETKRTQEEVERQFVETIEPIAVAMENGVYYKNEKDHCGWCGYYDKEKQRCRVELPT